MLVSCEHDSKECGAKWPVVRGNVSVFAFSDRSMERVAPLKISTLFRRTFVSGYFMKLVFPF